MPLQIPGRIGPMPRRCNLHIAVDGHGEYFLLLIKQANPGKDDNKWYETARRVAAAASQESGESDQADGHRRWVGLHPHPPPDVRTQVAGQVVRDILKSAFPDRIVNKLSHDLIQKYKESGAW